MTISNILKVYFLGGPLAPFFVFLIPIDDSIHYVEPINLQAETSESPEMKRIVISYNDKLVMAETLDQALVQIFGGQPVEKVKEQVQENVTSTDGNRYKKLIQERIYSNN